MSECGKEFVLPECTLLHGMDLDIRELFDLVNSRHVEVTINCTPESYELSIQPWRPYRPYCPYTGQTE